MAGPVAVFGVLSDISDIPLKYNPRLIFTPNTTATNLEAFTVPGFSRTAGGALYATGSVVADVGSSGYFSADLHPTGDLVPAGRSEGPVSYNVRIEWLDPVHGQSSMDFIQGLQVSESGGAIGAQIQASLPGYLLWAGPTLPARFNVPGNYWWNTTTDDIWKVV